MKMSEKSQFLKNWMEILRNCNYDNTYKMAWAKALTEISLEMDSTKHSQNSELIEITLLQMANKVLKYYWNQTIFFNLVQGSNPLKPPKILSLTKELIALYQEEKEDVKPERFEKAETEIKSNEDLNKQYIKILRKIVTALKSDVSYRFLNLGRKKLEGIYNYNKGDDSLFISYANLKTLKDNYEDIYETINYRWALILETFNTTPRICKKVKIIDEKGIKRKSLKRFMKYLDMDNPEHICFVCGRKVEEDLSIDHVIPWSYLYSDDLWNLVYVHRSCNSSKGNIVPNQLLIKRLEDRNKKLLRAVEYGKSDKVVEELKVAVENNYVYKLWTSCQG